jgi:hypothetical protein
MIFRKDKHRGKKIKDDRGDVVIVPFAFVYFDVVAVDL